MINKEELMNRILLLEPDLTQALLELISDYELKMIKLEKQDEILEILKKNIEIVDTDFVDEDGDDIFKIQLKPLTSSNQRIIEEWLGNNLWI